MSDTRIMLPWIAAAVITACLVGIAFGLKNSRRREIPGWVLGLGIIWVMILCVMFAMTTETGYGRLKLAIRGLVVLTAALSHAAIYILARYSSHPAGHGPSGRDMIARNPRFTGLLTDDTQLTDEGLTQRDEPIGHHPDAATPPSDS